VLPYILGAAGANYFRGERSGIWTFAFVHVEFVSNLIGPLRQGVQRRAFCKQHLKLLKLGVYFATHMLEFINQTH